MRTFNAHWGILLTATSILGTALCLGIGGWAGAEMIKTGQAAIGSAACLLVLLIILGCGLFTVRGYTLIPGTLFIHRLFWATQVSLRGLQSASFEPHSMRWSIRTFGNSGLFSFSGRYWSRRLGSYRAFVTDLRDTVVLRFARRTIVISPDQPGEFIFDLQQLQR